jgi:hypothetical protein
LITRGFDIWEFLLPGSLRRELAIEVRDEARNPCFERALFLRPSGSGNRLSALTLSPPSTRIWTLEPLRSRAIHEFLAEVLQIITPAISLDPDALDPFLDPARQRAIALRLA